MALPFVDRDPDRDEIRAIQLCFSLFTDGSGSETEADQTTRIGWRQMERVFADLFAGVGPENKEVFDVTLPYEGAADIGLSVKSKTLSEKDFNSLDQDGRVYMELANSPAIIWAALNQKGLRKEDLKNPNKIAILGDALIDVVLSWHEKAKSAHSQFRTGRNLDLGRSIYLCVSMAKPTSTKPRRFRVHSYSLKLPKAIKWELKTERCLRGYDPDFPENALFDWYPDSGGQIKFYPRADSALHSTPEFPTISVPSKDIKGLLAAAWPEDHKHLTSRIDLFKHLLRKN